MPHCACQNSRQFYAIYSHWCWNVDNLCLAEECKTFSAVLCALLCPKPGLSPETFCLAWLCCHKGPQKLRTIPKVCRLRPSLHLLLHKKKHNFSKNASLLVLRLKEGGGEGVQPVSGPNSNSYSQSLGHGRSFCRTQPFSTSKHPFRTPELLNVKNVNHRLHF